MPSIQTEKNPKTKRVLMWNVSSPAADFLFSLSNVVLIVGAAAVLIGTIGSIKMGAVREYFADIRISDNERETSKANVRAAGLEKEAATARLETEKLKSVVQWRTFSAAQNVDMENVLSAKPGSVNLRWMDGDPEAMFLAIQLSQLLQRAHWNVAPGSVKPANGIIFGILLPPMAGDDTETLRKALIAAKLSFSAVPAPAGGVSFNMSSIDGAPFLYIGSRMPVVP
jgi:hypothetical protein